MVSKEEMIKEEMGEVVEEKHFPIINKLAEGIKILEEVEEYFEKLSDLQQEIDYELCDLLHFLQKINKDKKKLTLKQCANLVNIIQEKRLIRESLNNDYEIKNVYNAQKNKIPYDKQRDMFIHEVYKKEKDLNSVYRWRKMTEEEIWELIK